jgi:hypothetical protein
MPDGATLLATSVAGWGKRYATLMALGGPVSTRGSLSIGQTFALTPHR